MSKETGGPAFPLPMATLDGGGIVDAADLEQEGMTLRDYFAAKALQSLIAGRSWDHLKSHEEIIDAWAAAAYKTADAMIAERAK